MSTPWAWASLSKAWTFPPIEASTITGCPFGHQAGTTAPEAEPRGSGSTSGGGAGAGTGAGAGSAGGGSARCRSAGPPGARRPASPPAAALALRLGVPVLVACAGRQPLGACADDLVEGGGDVGDLPGVAVCRSPPAAASPFGVPGRTALRRRPVPVGRGRRGCPPTARGPRRPDERRLTPSILTRQRPASAPWPPAWPPRRRWRRRRLAASRWPRPGQRRDSASSSSATVVARRRSDLHDVAARRGHRGGHRGLAPQFGDPLLGGLQLGRGRLGSPGLGLGGGPASAAAIAWSTSVVEVARSAPTTVSAGPCRGRLTGDPTATSTRACAVVSSPEGTPGRRRPERPQ